MEWLTENWAWLLIGGAFIGMHFFMHRGHGGHGGGAGGCCGGMKANKKVSDDSGKEATVAGHRKH